MIKLLCENYNIEPIDWVKYSSNGRYYLSLFVDCDCLEYDSNRDEWVKEYGFWKKPEFIRGFVENCEIDINNFDLWDWLQKNCALFLNWRQSNFEIVNYGYNKGIIKIEVLADENGNEYEYEYDCKDMYDVSYYIYLKINDMYFDKDDLFKLLPEMY